jgi:myo-inositol-1(or 4)-monophosphatase
MYHSLRNPKPNSLFSYSTQKRFIDMINDRLQVEQIELIKDWAVQAGQLAQEWQDHGGETLKNDNTLVSEADLVVERFLVEKIQAEFPGHQIIAEESGRAGDATDWAWAIDPIDGTKSFIRRMPVWGVSIGLLYRSVPAAGVIYLPVSQDLFWGWEGGAYWNGRSLAPQMDQEYEDSGLFLAVHAHAREQHALGYPRLKSTGSTVAHLAFLSAGLAVGALVRRVHIWDLAAGMAILCRAGYAIEYLSGRPLDLRPLMGGHKCGEELLASRPEWMGRLRSQIQ